MKRKAISILTSLAIVASLVTPVLADNLQDVTITSNDVLSIESPTNIILNSKIPGGTWSATVYAKIQKTGNNDNHVLPATVYFTTGENEFSIYFGKDEYDVIKSVNLIGNAQSTEGLQNIIFSVTSTDSNQSANLTIPSSQADVEVSFNVVNPAPVIVAPTVAWPTATITYGDQLTASSFGNGSASYNGVDVPGIFSFTNLQTSLLDASATGYNYSATFTPTDTTKYTTVTGTSHVNVNKRDIEVTADAKSKVYGDVDPSLEYNVTLGSLVAGDSFTGSLTRMPGENVGTYAINQGTLALSNNYNLTFGGVNLTIAARPIIVTADATSKIYGDVDPSFTYKVTSGNLVTGDSFTGSLSRISGENVGTYAVIQGSLTAGDNYSLKFVGANFTINYLYGGILQPINADNTSVFKLGSTVPVKFQLKDYKSNVVTTVASVMPTISVKKLSGTISGTITEPTYTDVAMTGTTFKYDDAAKQYVFNLSTKGWTAGTYEIRINIDNCVGVVPVQISSK
jgi:hypothetical protein